MQKNKLDKIFGPIGSGIGLLIIIFGVFTLSESYLGIFVILIGIFVAFSTIVVYIDYQQNKIKFSNNLFGIIPVGKWLDIAPNMKIGIKKSNKRWRIHSRSNRHTDIHEKSYRLVLYDIHEKELIQIKKFDNLNLAKKESLKIAEALGIELM
jgi:hypothetical protein